MESSRQCPFCGQIINASAKKCRYCGKWLNESNHQNSFVKKCPYCGETINVNAQKCRFCGQWLTQQGDSNMTYEKVSSNRLKTEINPFPSVVNNHEPSLRIWKLVSGILSIAFSSIIILQSCATGLVNVIGDNEEDDSDSAGVLVSIMLLVAGIISIVTSKSTSRGGNIALAVLYGIGAFFAFIFSGGTFSDIKFWGVWSLVCAVLAVIANKNNTQKFNEISH